MDFATRYKPPKSPSLACKDASLTRQEYVRECDLNDIMRRYAAGLAPLPVGSREPMYGDFSAVPDYQGALQIVIDAQSRFSELPSDLRKRFANDPAQLMEFLSDESNRDEAVRLGLLPAPVVEPAKVEPAKGGQSPEGAG